MTKPQIIGFITSWLIRALLSTTRFRLVDCAGLFDPKRDTPVIWAFWHNRLLAVPQFYEKNTTRPGAALTSASRDGELVAQVLWRFGIRPVRGSSSRRGAGALIEMKNLARNGCDIAITPDGPRGPRYELNPGIITLAQKTGAPIVPLGVEYSRCVRVGRWDRLMIPLPFCRVEVTAGQLVTVRPTANDEEFEAERQRVKQALMAMTKTN
jgi:hypothetical protein